MAYQLPHIIIQKDILSGDIQVIIDQYPSIPESKRPTLIIPQGITKLSLDPLTARTIALEVLQALDHNAETETPVLLAVQ